MPASENKSECFYHPSSDNRNNELIFLVHAMYTDSGYFLKPANNNIVNFLNNNGFDVCRINLSGYREGDTLNSEISFRTYVEDVQHWIKKYTADNRKIYLIGHSVGGVASLIAGSIQNIPEIIAVAPAVWTFTHPVNKRLTMRQFLILTGVYLVTEITGYFPSKKFGVGNINAPKGYFREYMHWALRRKFRSEDDNINYEEILANSCSDNLILAAVHDQQMAPFENVNWLYSRLPEGKRELLAVSKENNFNFDSDHFSIIHSENAGRYVWPEIVKWLRG